MTYMRILLVSFFLSLLGCGGSSPPAPVVPTYTGAFLGADWFAASNSAFPCDKALSVTEGLQKPAFGYLWGTFGSDHECLYRFLQKHAERPHLVRIHIANEVCRRHRNCGIGEIEPFMDVQRHISVLERREGWLLEKYHERMRNIVDWLYVHANSNTEILWSSGLEHNMTGAASVVLWELMRATESYGTIFNSVDNVIGPIQYDFTELHHAPSTEGRCVAALDGADIFWPHQASSYPRQWDIREVEQWGLENSKVCRAVFLWSARSQGLGVGGHFVQPRVRSYWLSDEDVHVMRNILVNIQRRNIEDGN